MPSKPLRIAVVGASGMVGRELIFLLEKRCFPATDILLFGSGKSRSRMPFRGRSIPIQPTTLPALAQAELVFLTTGDSVSRELAPILAQKGTWVIDDSAAFRMDSKVPLIIPEINAHSLSLNKRLIAGPNCSMAALAMAIYPIYEKFGIRSIRAATYQSVSGAGKAAIQELKDQTYSKNPSRPKALPQLIAFNLFPQIGSFDRNGYTSEETKISGELKKVLGTSQLHVTVTAVRVPVFRGHSIAAWVGTRRRVQPREIETCLQNSPGICLSRKNKYPMPIDIAGSWPVYVGRVRRGESDQEVLLWIVSDNLLKGAALNSVQIAEHLLKRGWLWK
ncbi:MAG: aspartate-semialdehyde dehydrogenase [Elusimicrobia bacterium]|nr:aspartate-semialdehyde dehydrogenase [Elusimicrobiota bacterium]